MTSTYACRLNQAGWQGKNRNIRAGGWLRISSGMFNGYRGGKNLGWKDGVLGAPREMLYPAPRDGYVEGQYVAVLFNYPLDCSFVPFPKAFQLIVDELEEQVPASISMPGGVLLLQLKEPVEPDRQAVLQYFPPAKQPLQDEDGVKVEAFTLLLKNLGEHATAGNGGITWSDADKIDVSDTNDGCLRISWLPANISVAFYRLIVFIGGELTEIYESPETFVTLEELDPDGEYEFLVVGVDREGRSVGGSYARWPSRTA